MRSVMIFFLFGMLISDYGFAQETISPSQRLIREGDRHWDLRAEGSQGSKADSKEIDQALSAYRQALALDSGSLAVRWRLMRALYFKAEYTTNNNDEKKKIFDEGKVIGEEALQHIRPEAAQRTGKPMEKADPTELAPLIKETPDVIGCFFWSSANWGGWALAFGKFQAARQGAAAKIRDLATAVIQMDPNYAEGGGYRVLGRLHHQTPAIPFITGWASTKEAVKLLRRANEVGPQNFLNRLYLAEALWDQGRSFREEALKIVEALISDTPRPGYLVEDRAAQEKARALWEAWRKS